MQIMQDFIGFLTKATVCSTRKNEPIDQNMIYCPQITQIFLNLVALVSKLPKFFSHKASLGIWCIYFNSECGP